MKINLTKLVKVAGRLIIAAPVFVTAVKPVITAVRKASKPAS